MCSGGFETIDKLLKIIMENKGWFKFNEFEKYLKYNILLSTKEHIFEFYELKQQIPEEFL